MERILPREILRAMLLQYEELWRAKDLRRGEAVRVEERQEERGNGVLGIAKLVK